MAGLRRKSLVDDGQPHDRFLPGEPPSPCAAFTLMNHFYRAGHGPEGKPRPTPLHFAGTGFRDFTPLPEVPPRCGGYMPWHREALANQIDTYQHELAALREMLASGDGEALEKAFANARQARQQWLKNTP